MAEAEAAGQCSSPSPPRLTRLSTPRLRVGSALPPLAPTAAGSATCTPEGSCERPSSRAASRCGENGGVAKTVVRSNPMDADCDPGLVAARTRSGDTAGEGENESRCGAASAAYTLLCEQRERLRHEIRRVQRSHRDALQRLHVRAAAALGEFAAGRGTCDGIGSSDTPSAALELLDAVSATLEEKLATAIRGAAEAHTSVEREKRDTVTLGDIFTELEARRDAAEDMVSAERARTVLVRRAMLAGLQQCAAVCAREAEAAGSSPTNTDAENAAAVLEEALVYPATIAADGERVRRWASQLEAEAAELRCRKDDIHRRHDAALLREAARRERQLSAARDAIGAARKELLARVEAVEQRYARERSANAARSKCQWEGTNDAKAAREADREVRRLVAQRIELRRELDEAIKHAKQAEACRARTAEARTLPPRRLVSARVTHALCDTAHDSDAANIVQAA